MGKYVIKLGKRLTDLMEKNYDAEKEFKKAANKVKLAKLKSYFINKAQERHDFGDQLKSELQGIDQKNNPTEVDKYRSFPIWIDIKSWFFEDDEAMLKKAINGDIMSIEEYNDVLKNNALPYAIKELLKIQKHTIEYSVMNIRELQDL